jgi:hypothetical protein
LSKSVIGFGSNGAEKDQDSKKLVQVEKYI